MILLINNYPRKEDLHKIGMIKKALLILGKCEVLVWSFSEIDEQLLPQNIEAVILSGANKHLNKPKHIAVYQSEIEFVRKVNVPLLGICFGHQLIGIAFGSRLYSTPDYIKNFQNVKILQPNEILSSWKEGDNVTVYQYHKDCLSELPEGFVCLAESQSCNIEAMKHRTRPIYGIQAHIERATTENPHGLQILRNFVENVVETCEL